MYNVQCTIENQHIFKSHNSNNDDQQLILLYIKQMILRLPPINDGEGVEVLESRHDLGGVEKGRGGGEVARSDCCNGDHHGGVVHHNGSGDHNDQ